MRRENLKMRRDGNSRAITLISLVVTIVILLILAGVSINFVIGNNGIIAKAKDAKIESRAATVKDERDLWMNERNIAEKIGDNAKSMNQILEELQERKLLTKEEVERVKKDTNNEITIGSKTISFKVSDYEISSTMTSLYKYYVLKDESGYQLKNDGTDVISIDSKNEMKYLAEYTNLSNITENVKFILLKDINLNPETVFSKDGSITGATPETWTPIGTMQKMEVSSQTEWENKVSQYGKLYTLSGISEKYDKYEKTYYYAIPFKGDFYGKGNSIKGLYCNDKKNDFFGVFGVVDGSKINNLEVTDSYISAGNAVSALVAGAIEKGVTCSEINCKDNYIIINEYCFRSNIGISM